MSRSRIGGVALLAVRIAYGAGLVLIPERLAGEWLGRSARRGPTQVPLRALGAREIALHGGALRALLMGAPVRSWLLASIAGDLSDIVATTAARDSLPEGAAAKTLAVGGGSALLTMLLAAAVDSETVDPGSQRA